MGLRLKRKLGFGQRANGEHVFKDIFSKKSWGDCPSVSGYGSTEEATAHIRVELPKLFERHGITHLIDVPCGDLFWMQHLLPSLKTYTGLDIVPEIIEANRKKYPSGTCTFEVLDITKDPLPSGDAILVRDLFIHLPEEDIKRALRNIAQSEITYCLLSNYPNLDYYKEIDVGGCRSVNLLAAPFNLPAPDAVIEETWEGKDLSLWRVQRLKSNSR